MIYFKDPRIKVHREKWGAVVRLEDAPILLDVCQVDCLDDLTEVRVREGEVLPQVMQSLVDRGLVLSIDEDVAAEVKSGS